MSRKNKILLVSIILILVLVISPFIAVYTIKSSVRKNVADTITSISGACTITYGDVDYSIWKRHLYIKDASLICNNEEIGRFGLLDISNIVRGKNLPTGMVVDYSDGIINLNTSFFGKYGELSESLGYTAVPVRGTIAYAIRVVSKDINVTTFTLNADNIGIINMKMNIPNVEKTTPSEIIAQALSNKGAFISIAFQDNGLTTDVLKKYADTLGIEVQEAGEKAYNGFQNRIVANNDNDTIKDKYVQLQKFLKTPGAISVTLKKDDNMSINDILGSLNDESFRALANSIKEIPVTITAQ